MCIHIIDDQDRGVLACAAAVLLMGLLVGRAAAQVVQPVGLVLLDWRRGGIQLMQPAGTLLQG